MTRREKQEIVVEWQYKCRRCGDITYSKDSFTEDKNWERDYASAVSTHLEALELSFRSDDEQMDVLRRKPHKRKRLI